VLDFCAEAETLQDHLGTTLTDTGRLLVIKQLHHVLSVDAEKRHDARGPAAATLTFTLTFTVTPVVTWARRRRVAAQTGDTQQHRSTAGRFVHSVVSFLHTKQ